MGDQQFVVSYLKACASGKLPALECAPVWQLLAIAAGLMVAIAVLVVLRLRAGAGPGA